MEYLLSATWQIVGTVVSERACPGLPPRPKMFAIENYALPAKTYHYDFGGSIAQVASRHKGIIISLA